MKQLLALFMLISFAVNVHSQWSESENPLPFDQEVRTGTLPNGMKYFIRKNARPEKRAELRLVVNAGSTSEEDDQQGLAHFCEHMAFNGTEHFAKNDLVNYLESIGTKFGPHLNAYTSFDETVYMLRIPTDDQKFIDNGMLILEDWAHACSYDNTEIDKERGVVTEEWRLGLGANKRMQNKTYPIYFMGSRYADRLPIGKQDIIQNAPYERLKSFYRDWYRPDNMAVIVVGDIDVDAMEKMIREKFSVLKNPQGEKKVMSYNVPNHDDLRIAVATDKEAMFTNVQVSYFHENNSFTTVGDYRREITFELYNSMLTDRLNELSKQPNPPFTFGVTMFGSMVRTKSNYASFAMVSEDGIARGLKTILEENERVKKFGFTQTELDRTKKAVMRDMEEQLAEKEKTESAKYASEYVQHFLKGIPSPGVSYEMELYKKFIDGIQLSEVNALAQKWILPNGKNCTVTITGPDKPGVKIPDDNAIRALFDEVQKETLEPYTDNFSDLPLMSKLPSKGKVLERTDDKVFGTTRLKLSNDAIVILKKTEFKNDQILFSAGSFGGSSLVSDKEYMSAVNASSIAQEGGIGPFNRLELEKYMSAKIANVNSVIRETQESINGSASPSDLETFMQLIHLKFGAPRMDDEFYESFIDRQHMMAKNLGSDPRNAYMDTIMVTMYDHHFRKRPYKESHLDEIDQKVAYRIYKDRFENAADFVFVFVGNFDEKILIPYIEQYIASLPSSSKREKAKDLGYKYPTGKINKTVYKGTEQKSEVNYRFHGAASYNLNDNLTFQALQKLMGVKLRESLREENGGTYGVSCSGSMDKIPREEYFLNINFSCGPENVEKLTKATEEVIRSVKANGCAELDLQKVKETFRRDRETNLQENGFWLSRLLNAELYGDKMMTDAEYTSFFEKLTSDDLKKAAIRYFDMDNYGYYLWLPEKK